MTAEKAVKANKNRVGKKAGQFARPGQHGKSRFDSSPGLCQDRYGLAGGI